MALRPVERSYSDRKEHKGPKDVDAADTVNKLKAALWALGPGAFFGLVGGSYVGHPILGLFGGMAILFFGVMGISASAGRAMETIYMPSGRGSRKKEYSRGEALVAAGEYKDAIITYEGEILDDPAAPEPYLRIARIFRDNLKDRDEALAWFKRATREAELSGGQEIRTRREIAEIFMHHRNEPRKAAPELARLVESYPDTPDGQWAARELARIKEEMAAAE